MNASVIIPPSLNTFPLGLNALLKFLFCPFMCVTVENNLVFSIMWMHVFAVCSYMLLILFCLFLSISPWAQPHPWVRLCHGRNWWGQHLMGRGDRLEPQLLPSSSALSVLQRRCSGGCPCWPGSLLGERTLQFIVLPQPGSAAGRGHRIPRKRPRGLGKGTWL